MAVRWLLSWVGGRGRLVKRGEYKQTWEKRSLSLPELEGGL